MSEQAACGRKADCCVTEDISYRLCLLDSGEWAAWHAYSANNMLLPMKSNELLPVERHKRESCINNKHVDLHAMQ